MPKEPLRRVSRDYTPRQYQDRPEQPPLARSNSSGATAVESKKRAAACASAAPPRARRRARQLLRRRRQLAAGHAARHRAAQLAGRGPGRERDLPDPRAAAAGRPAARQARPGRRRAGRRKSRRPDPHRPPLAARLRRGRADAPGEGGPDQIRPRAADLAELPLSYGQEQLWFLDRLARGQAATGQAMSGQAAYNVPQALRLSGPLDPAALD